MRIELCIYRDRRNEFKIEILNEWLYSLDSLNLKSDGKNQ